MQIYFLSFILMKKQERSRERSRSGIRKHKRKNGTIAKDEDSSDSENKSNYSSDRKRSQYTLMEKKSYVNQYYEIKDSYPKKGVLPMAKSLGVPYTCLLEWIKQYKYIELTTNKKERCRLEGGGRLPSTLLIEDELMKWICEQRRNEIAITTQEIINKSIELDVNQKNKSPTALEHWCIAYLRRYSYGIRTSTHIGQKLKSCSDQDYKEFLKILYSLRYNTSEINQIFQTYIIWMKLQFIWNP